MFSYRAFLLISSCCYLLIKCPLVQTRKLKPSREICVENQIQTYSVNHLRLCYSNHQEDRLTFVWFSVDESLNDTFDYYRFTSRMNESPHAARSTIEILTDFTQLIDANNSLRMYNLDTGQYEVCVEFRSELPLFIYQPRDGCITIDVGRSTNQTFAYDSTPVISGISLWYCDIFILGLVVQWAKVRRAKRLPEAKDEPRSLPSRILSSKSLRQQRDRLVRNIFKEHLDHPRVSRIQQWARDQASRHRVSTHEIDLDIAEFIEKRNIRRLSSINRSPPSTPPDDTSMTSRKLSTISEDTSETPSPAKVSFQLSPTEDLEMELNVL